LLVLLRKEPKSQSGCLCLAASSLPSAPRGKQIAFPIY
jgi:hypothetical protein